MGEQFACAEERGIEPTVNIGALVDRLDREDVLLLKEFYHMGLPYPDDTISHVLRLLVDKLKRSNGPLAKLSYGAVRYRLENLTALGLLGKIPQTNPAVYYPLDVMVGNVRKMILLFAADFVGVWKKGQGGCP